MRALILICVLVVAAYWIDQRYYGGTYTEQVVAKYHEITANFRTGH